MVLVEAGTGANSLFTGYYEPEVAGSRSPGPEYPVPIGVFYCDPAQSYDSAVTEQNAAIVAKAPAVDLNALMRKGRTWTVT